MSTTFLKDNLQYEIAHRCSRIEYVQNRIALVTLYFF